MVAKSTSTPAPIGGLNDRDSIADMKSTEAIILDNWWPYPSYVGIRKGSINHVTGFPAAVETLAEYLPPSGSPKLFAAAGTAIYDATTPGAVGAAVQTGLTNAQWQTQGITTPGGSFLYFVNGADSPRLWNGTTWTTITGASVPAITGVTTSLFAHVCLFKNRLFFTENNALRVWYLPVNSIGGAASQLDLGSVFRNGGRIEACFTWTIDAGNGSDDHFVIITSNGEVAVYEGTDPSSASAWRLVGVFNLGRPLGRRCGTKYGGDLAINTTEGLYPLGKALLSSTVSKSVALTDKIQNATSLATAAYRNNTGWDVETYADYNMLILNVPAGNGANFQYAQNTITGAWTKFVGWDARCWINASSGLYYGSSNAIIKAWVGTTDNSVSIRADVLPAFSYFGQKARNKFFSMVRPNIQTDGDPAILYSLNVDFAPELPEGVLDYAPAPGMTWGAMTWGSMTWGGSLAMQESWEAVGDVANSAALRMVVLNNGSDVRFNSVDYVYQVGGIL